MKAEPASANAPAAARSRRVSSMTFLPRIRAFLPQRLAELSARDDEHSKIGGARGAQFGGDGVGRGELAGMGIEPGGERVGGAIRANGVRSQHARGEVGLEDVEIVDQGLDRGLLP